jgi:hypothetical protein
MSENKTGMDPDDAFKRIAADGDEDDAEGHATPKLGSTPERAMEPDQAFRFGKVADEDTGTEADEAFRFKG